MFWALPLAPSRGHGREEPSFPGAPVLVERETDRTKLTQPNKSGVSAQKGIKWTKRHFIGKNIKQLGVGFRELV